METPAVTTSLEPEAPSLARLALVLVGTPLGIVGLLALIRLF